jgi:glycosyltransferase involved in cell wall biosynthesis
VAVLEPRKGHRVLLEALERLRKEGLDPLPAVAFAGDGPERPELERLCREKGLAGDVFFLGWESRHFNVFNAADAMALPSVGYEDAPNVIAEAMGLGKPVVVTDVGGIAEIFKDGESGLLTRPGDAADLARNLGKLCRDAGLRERMGRAAAAVFQSRFTAAASVDRYRALYRSLLTP